MLHMMLYIILYVDLMNDLAFYICDSFESRT